MQRHLFIIDPISTLSPKFDSSLRLAFALINSGHEVDMCEVESLSWSGADPSARVQALKGSLETPLMAAKESKSLTAYDAIHMRKDPPYDLHYISAVWILNRVADRVRVYNEPLGLLAVNEKLSILDFGEFIAPALVSCSVDEICSFISTECGMDAMIKPLTLFGGKGIERIRAKNSEELQTVVQGLFGKQNQFRLIQPFDSAIYRGEVRAFCFAGQAISWCLKMPKSGEYMANTNFGSTRHSHTPTPQEIKAVETVSRQLLHDYKIKVVGFDLIGGKISEINITSPRLLHPDHDQTPYYEQLAKLIVTDQ